MQPNCGEEEVNRLPPNIAAGPRPLPGPSNQWDFQARKPVDHQRAGFPWNTRALGHRGSDRERQQIASHGLVIPLSCTEEGPFLSSAQDASISRRISFSHPQRQPQPSPGKHVAETLRDKASHLNCRSGQFTFLRAPHPTPTHFKQPVAFSFAGAKPRAREPPVSKSFLPPKRPGHCCKLEVRSVGFPAPACNRSTCLFEYARLAD